MQNNPAPPTKAEQTTNSQSVIAKALHNNTLYTHDILYIISGVNVPQGKASIYADLLDTLKLLEEDPEPLRQSEKV